MLLPRLPAAAHVPQPAQAFRAGAVGLGGRTCLTLLCAKSHKPRLRFARPRCHSSSESAWSLTPCSSNKGEVALGDQYHQAPISDFFFLKIYSSHLCYVTPGLTIHVKSFQGIQHTNERTNLFSLGGPARLCSAWAVRFISRGGRHHPKRHFPGEF